MDKYAEFNYTYAKWVIVAGYNTYHKDKNGRTALYKNRDSAMRAIRRLRKREKK